MLYTMLVEGNVVYVIVCVCVCMYLNGNMVHVIIVCVRAYVHVCEIYHHDDF